MPRDPREAADHAERLDRMRRLSSTLDDVLEEGRRVRLTADPARAYPQRWPCPACLSRRTIAVDQTATHAALYCPNCGKRWNVPTT